MTISVLCADLSVTFVIKIKSDINKLPFCPLISGYKKTSNTALLSLLNQSSVS